jgi:Uma2 family endonuclease
MTTLLEAPKPFRTISDLLRDLGDVPADRVLLHPPPGTATVEDVIAVKNRDGRLCELVDGTLVEKGMGIRESMLAVALAAILRSFVIPRNLGIVTGPDGMMKLFASLIRIPDVAYVSWQRLPGGRLPSEPVPLLAPDLAIEVLSESNTRAEMARKRREYFEAGVLLVWEVDPASRTVIIYTAPERSTTLTQQDSLDGGAVLPGFALPLRELFAELDRHSAASPTA